MANEKRLIDLNDIFPNRCFYVNANDPEKSLDELISRINNAPTVDAVEVVHGRWAHLGGDEWCCTNCGEVIHTEGSWEKPDKKYCYECGAKMDGDGNG